ncbi:MAG: LPS assembly lipoprotein LptE [Thermogutta sp.]
MACPFYPQLWLTFTLALLTTAAGCAGYRVGNATLFRPDIETVYVPVFQSSSLRPGLGERLTEAVIKEIELRTPYKVVGSLERADSILTGRIVSETKRTVVENPYDDPREVATRFQVEVQWIDQRGQALSAEETIPVPSELTTVVTETTFVPEVGQSLATAHQAAIQRLAAQIVGMMENPW